MGEDVNNLTQLLQGMKVDEAGAQGIVQDGGKRVHEGGQARALWILPWKEVVKQLMLVLTHLHQSRHQHESLFAVASRCAWDTQALPVSCPGSFEAAACRPLCMLH